MAGTCGPTWHRWVRVGWLARVFGAPYRCRTCGRWSRDGIRPLA